MKFTDDEVELFAAYKEQYDKLKEELRSASLAKIKVNELLASLQKDHNIIRKKLYDLERKYNISNMDNSPIAISFLSIIKHNPIFIMV